MRLSFDDLKRIEQLVAQGVNAPAIANQIGWNVQSIDDELRRGSVNGVYSAAHSMELREASRKKKGNRKKGQEILAQDEELARRIADMICTDHKSPEAIAEWLKTSDKKSMRTISRNTIYNAIDKNLIPGVTRETLSSYISMFSGGHIIIPKWIREKYGYADGDHFIVVEGDGGVICLIPSK